MTCKPESKSLFGDFAAKPMPMATGTVSAVFVIARESTIGAQDFTE